MFKLCRLFLTLPALTQCCWPLVGEMLGSRLLLLGLGACAAWQPPALRKDGAPPSQILTPPAPKLLRANGAEMMPIGRTRKRRPTARITQHTLIGASWGAGGVRVGLRLWMLVLCVCVPSTCRCGAIDLSVPPPPLRQPTAAPSPVLTLLRVAPPTCELKRVAQSPPSSLQKWRILHSFAPKRAGVSTSSRLAPLRSAPTPFRPPHPPQSSVSPPPPPQACPRLRTACLVPTKPTGSTFTTACTARGSSSSGRRSTTRSATRSSP